MSRNPILAHHFGLMEKIQTDYRRRNSAPKFLVAAVRACEEQISLAPEAARAFRNDGLSLLPAHTGFEQLVIIREKEGDFEEAIRLCEEAKTQGWGQGCSAGPVDWNKRISRLSKKLSQRGKNGGKGED